MDVVAAVQETHLTCSADGRVLENDYVVLSAYGCRSSVGVSLLIGRSFDADVSLVLGDDRAGLLWPMLPLSFEFQLAAVYAPNIVVECWRNRPVNGRQLQIHWKMNQVSRAPPDERL